MEFESNTNILRSICFIEYLPSCFGDGFGGDNGRKMRTQSDQRSSPGPFFNEEK